MKGPESGQARSRLAKRIPVDKNKLVSDKREEAMAQTDPSGTDNDFTLKPATPSTERWPELSTTEKMQQSF